MWGVTVLLTIFIGVVGVGVYSACQEDSKRHLIHDAQCDAVRETIILMGAEKAWRNDVRINYQGIVEIVEPVC